MNMMDSNTRREIFGLKTVSYWQAWGLVALAHILV